MDPSPQLPKNNPVDFANYLEEWARTSLQWHLNTLINHAIDMNIARINKDQIKVMLIKQDYSPSPDVIRAHIFYLLITLNPYDLEDHDMSWRDTIKYLMTHDRNTNIPWQIFFGLLSLPLYYHTPV
jgi:hypothetical protein